MSATFAAGRYFSRSCYRPAASGVCPIDPAPSGVRMHLAPLARRSMFASALLALCFTVTGCGNDGVSGNTYVDADGQDTLVFHSGGKVDVIIMNMKQEGTYKVNGDKVELTPAQQMGTTMILTKKGDDLDGGMMLGLLKKKK
jgi:hypothetical protein